MRKKTIKFYFSKLLKKNPSVYYLFCFSKRSFRRNRQVIKYKSRASRLAARRVSRKNFYEFLMINKSYKTLTKIKIKKTQWINTREPLKSFFIKSFFFSIRWFTLSRKYRRKFLLQLKLWFKLKSRFNRFLIKFISNFHKLGSLSSDNVHSISRKNLSYQSRSKYRPKLFNMNIYNEQFYNISRHNYICNYILLGLIYSFSSDPRERNTCYDENFNLIINERSSSMSIERSIFKNAISHTTMKTIGPLLTSPNAIDLISLLEYNATIEEFLSESDKSKQNEIQKHLDSNLNITSAIFLSRFFVIYAQSLNFVIPKLYLNLNVKLYSLLFKYTHNK